jgi:hypothetical protein
MFNGFNGSTGIACGPRARSERRALPARRVYVRPAVKVAGLLILSAVASGCGQAPDGKQDPAPARWTILFCADDPTAWDTAAMGAKGEQIAIPLRLAPAEFRYLRLRRMDTGEALILPLTPDQLQNDKPPASEAGFWWNGSNKEEWKGRHLGIVQAPRQKFPAPKGTIAVMNDGWDGFVGSGFGHKCFVNNAQYYCWRGKQIPRTVFEIGVSNGPLSTEEERCLVSVESTSGPPEAKTTTWLPSAPPKEPDANWTILFRADDPSAWDKDAMGAKGEQIAIPLKSAPAEFRYLRLRRMDTREELILPLSPKQLRNGKPPASEAGSWWNGTSKEEWKGRHLGIVQGPRHKFPAPKGMIAVMNDGWDGFAGSGFGHKCFVNDAQYYCWRGEEIPRTVFEIGVSDGPLSTEEKDCLVSAEFTNDGPEANTNTLLPSESPDLAAALAGSSKLNHDNFDLIKNGMTEDEVTAILGPPLNTTTRMGTYNGHEYNNRFLVWKHYIPNQYYPYLTITVTIRSEKVTGKNWIQIGPKQP